MADVNVNPMSLTDVKPESEGAVSLKKPAKTGENLYKIGDLAELVGATTRTLRYYEEMGLLVSVRNASGQRLYDEGAVTRLKFINELKSGGFSLNEVKGFFDAWRRESK